MLSREKGKLVGVAQIIQHCLPVRYRVGRRGSAREEKGWVLGWGACCLACRVCGAIERDRSQTWPDLSIRIYIILLFYRILLSGKQEFSCIIMLFFS